MLDENSSWMRPEQIYEHVKALNDPDRDTLPIIWEVAVLNALCKLGQVEHEPKAAGRTPDICFRLAQSGPLIVADINTVSDRSFHARNPIERLEEHFRKQLAPLLDSRIHGGFHLVVRDDVKERNGRGGAPTRLKIPPVKRFKEAIFNAEFIAFKSKVLQQPRSPAIFAISTDECDMRLTYEPNGSGWSSGMPVVTSAPTIRHNPVWNALYKKADQLKEVSIPGTRGIILCDGDCELLRRTTGNWDSFGLDEVVREFLRQRKSVAFVLAITAGYSKHAPNLNPRNLYIESYLYHRLKSAPLPDWLQAFLKVRASFPRPMSSPTNSRYHLEWLRSRGLWHEAPTFIGGLEMNGNSIRISARALLELLAGTLDRKQFDDAHDLLRLNPFLQQLRNGRLVKGVRIESDEIPERDDDWVVFEFGEQDAAVAPFTRKMPTASKP